ncbi:glycosyltransferase [Polaribacter sp.]|uniref:glycosyltransferase n=1 Tax=Polaribacter sp. TaxID=1920175 RepID=UPI0035C85398
MKKIIHLVSHFPSKSETFIINQIITSIEEGFTAKILATKIVDFETSSQPKLLNKYNLFDTAESLELNIPTNKFFRIFKAILLLITNIKDYKVFFRSLNNKRFKEKATSLKLWYQASLFLKFKDVAIFHAHFGFNGITLCDLKEIGAIKSNVLVSFYGYDTFSTLDTRESLKLSYQTIFKNAKYIITNSNYLFKNLTLLEVPKKKVIVNYVGVNQEIFKYKERVEKNVFNIITVGRLIELKGHLYGLKLIKELKDKNINVHYLVVGDGLQMKKLQQISKNLQISKNVTFYGSKNQQEILDLLYKSDLFLMTSITDNTGRAEGQGLVTAEAQATGLPVVGFNSGGVAETIHDDKTGFVIEEKNIDLMTEKVKLLIENFKIRREFGENAKIFVNRKFNNKKQALKITEVYKNIISQ